MPTTMLDEIKYCRVPLRYIIRVVEICFTRECNTLTFFVILFLFLFFLVGRIGTNKYDVELHPRVKIIYISLY